MRETVKTFDSPDGARRVQLFRREDGTFGFEELRWLEPEQAWVVSTCYTSSRTDSAESAEQEARSRVAWLARQDADDADRHLR